MDLHHHYWNPWKKETTTRIHPAMVTANWTSWESTKPMNGLLLLCWIPWRYSAPASSIPPLPARRRGRRWTRSLQCGTTLHADRSTSSIPMGRFCAEIGQAIRPGRQLGPGPDPFCRWCGCSGSRCLCKASPETSAPGSVSSTSRSRQPGRLPAVGRIRWPIPCSDEEVWRENWLLRSLRRAFSFDSSFLKLFQIREGGMVVIVFFVLAEMMSIQTIKEKMCVCCGVREWERERENTQQWGLCEDVIKMAAARQDGGRERKLVLLVLSTAQFTHNGTTKKGEKKRHRIKNHVK